MAEKAIEIYELAQTSNLCEEIQIENLDYTLEIEEDGGSNNISI